MPLRKQLIITQSNEKVHKPLHVCVIGAGVCGLVSIKACLENGLKVTCYEKSSQLGGLWCYRPAAVNQKAPDGCHQFEEPSVMRTTILNTSKELSAFSDFPPPAELPNFMRHNLYMNYIRSYVDQFKLLEHIKFQHQIIGCHPEWKIDSDNEKTARNSVDDAKQTDRLISNQGAQICWSVQVLDLKTGEKFVGHFDRLMIAIGHHNIPYMPTFINQNKFQGTIVHSAFVKDILTDSRFIDKRVLVVGLGNSACDAANDLAIVSSKCYVSCHRGNWFLSRLNADGLYDFKLKSRWYNYLAKVLPRKWTDKFLVKQLDRRTNHRLLGLEPKHLPSEHVPAINDLFPYRVFTGGICLKGSINRFTERGVIFEGEEDSEYEVDAIVLATGYVAKIPFLNEVQLGLKVHNEDEYELYLNMFAPRLTIPKSPTAEKQLEQSQQTEESVRLAIQSLAFIGLVQPSGSITVVSELQARYAVLLFSNRLKLPPLERMLQHIKQVRRARSSAIRSHSRDQLVGNWIGYLDIIAREMGVKPNYTRLFFKDFALWRPLVFGPSVPYQYRLQGPNKWSKAREVILGTNERVYRGINEGKNHVLFKSRRKCLADSRKTKGSGEKDEAMVR